MYHFVSNGYMLLIACNVTLFFEGRSVAAATPPVSFFKKRIALEATPRDLSRAMADQHQQAMQAQSHNQQQVLEQYQQQVRQTSQPVFSAVQNLWKEMPQGAEARPTLHGRFLKHWSGYSAARGRRHRHRRADERRTTGNRQRGAGYSAIPTAAL